ncbi:glutathione peroxidase (plasmid) [Arthrobacter sp. ERGS1:01]|uniref:glutathione peroxidase n=1 Tax=Arthrobacter sp. ERGS1:01 TaxID=1704044 RepID=UPI0006B579FA|nr:glutathione peroxidase [Arthrobacter sp. ERGS1:01]ALE04411.1 glutathione peroxidase [Arthrobacter sp. ERGS1:01]
MTTQTLNTIPLTLNDGSATTLGALSTKAVLVVNVASKCGFTAQYDALEALYEKYQEQGLEILGMPCNQFGGQEPGTAEEIADFCRKNFGVTFPLAAKADVNGDDAHPLFAALTNQGAEPVKWNFEKFLVNHDGELLARFDSPVTPDAPELVAAVEAALA